jgi:hypothetical protein
MEMWYIPVGICSAGLLTGVWVYLRYRRDVQAARKRVGRSAVESNMEMQDMASLFS